MVRKGIRRNVITQTENERWAEINFVHSGTQRKLRKYKVRVCHQEATKL